MTTSIQIGSTTLQLTQGDIVAQHDVDALVNAANPGLSGGGGVDGAIHKAAGPSLLEACKAVFQEHGRCNPGNAVITHAGNLPVQHIIHAVGPIWNGGTDGEYIHLENAYTRSLKLARTHNLRSIAFPSISTGAYRFPTHRAALVALGTIVREVRETPDAFDEVRFVLFSDKDLQTYTQALDEVSETMMG